MQGVSVWSDWVIVLIGRGPGLLKEQCNSLSALNLLPHLDAHSLLYHGCYLESSGTTNSPVDCRTPGLPHVKPSQEGNKENTQTV